MDSNHPYSNQSPHPDFQATLPVFLPTDHLSPVVVHTGGPYPQLIHPTPSISTVTTSVPAGNPGVFSYYPYNNNWGPEQENLFLRNVNQMAEELSTAGPAVPTNTQHYQCLWSTNGVICLHVCSDFDKLMLHLGHIHDVRGTAARRIDCGWLTKSGVCGKVYRRDGFRRHIGTHVGRSVTCNQCDKPFSRKDTLDAHMKKCHEKEG